jgi:signal transduction histidine kinase
MTPEREALERLQKLQSITDAALLHLTLDDLFAELLDRIRAALSADTCAVLLLDDKKEELVARAAKGLEEEVERGVRIPVGKGFAGRVVAEGRPVLIEDINHAEVVNPLLREKGIKTLLGAPLVGRGGVLGVVHVGTLSLRDFSADDVELLELVAQRLAAAIERTLVHESLVRLERRERDFIALASHELRTPAAVVYGIGETLYLRRGQLPPDQVEQLHAALHEQSSRLKRLVEQLLDLSRLEGRGIEIKPVPVELRKRIEHIAGGLSEAASDVRIEIDDDFVVNADPDALDRIVSNLLANACHHGQPPVTVAAAQVDRHLRLSVEDRGRGVSPDFVPHLFDRFHRGDPSPRDGTGAGLGLAIARAYARAHGGELRYEDAQPTGARFELVLPVG